MRKLHFFLLPVLLGLASCGAVSTSSSDLTNSSTTSSETSTESKASSSSEEGNSSSSQDLQGKIILNASNSMAFSEGAGRFSIPSFSAEASRAESSSSGWFLLKQGGCLSNTTPFASSFSSITVEFLRQSDFGYLTTKVSTYPITSPENGAYELTGATALTFSGEEAKNYFSLYAAVGSFVIQSITLTYSDNPSKTSAIDGLDFYTINDTHGTAQASASADQTGITRLSEFALTTERANPDSSVFLSSGDMWQGSADSNLTQGELMVNWMNVAGFESMAIGNHEFDWKPAVIAKNAQTANFPFLGINIVDPSGNRPSWAQPSKIVERGGYKIGVIGAIGSVQSSIAVSSLSGYSFLDNYADLISAEASRLRNDEGCSLVVVSIHNGSFDTTNCHNIDAVFEGHTHLDYLKVDSYGIPHIQTSAYGSNFRHVRFDLSNGKFVYKNCDSIDYAFLSALNEEPMTLGVFGYYDGKNSAVKNEVVGHTTSELSRYQIARYAVQCLFEYYCNSSWDSALALAVVNTGCSQPSHPAGDITYGEVYASLPFDNDNVFCSCKGSDVTALMNDSYLYSYGTQTSFDVETTYHVMVISYVSEKTSYSFLSEISRDDYRLRDIVADDLRRNKNA